MTHQAPEEAAKELLYNASNLETDPRALKSAIKYAEEEFIERAIEIINQQRAQAVEPYQRRSISTCPRHQKVQVFGLNSLNKERTTFAIYIEKFTFEQDDYNADCEFDEKTDLYYVPEGWYEYAESSETWNRLSFTPTQWVPLPPTPAKEGELC